MVVTICVIFSMEEVVIEGIEGQERVAARGLHGDKIVGHAGRSEHHLVSVDLVPRCIHECRHMCWLRERRGQQEGEGRSRVDVVAHEHRDQVVIPRRGCVVPRVTKWGVTSVDRILITLDDEAENSRASGGDVQEISTEVSGFSRRSCTYGIQENA